MVFRYPRKRVESWGNSLYASTRDIRFVTWAANTEEKKRNGVNDFPSIRSIELFGEHMDGVSANLHDELIARASPISSFHTWHFNLRLAFKKIFLKYNKLYTYNKMISFVRWLSLMRACKLRYDRRYLTDKLSINACIISADTR